MIVVWDEKEKKNTERVEMQIRRKFVLPAK